MRPLHAARTFRRCFSATSATTAKPLPFEKPIFESEILNKARADQRTYERLEYYGNLIVIAAGLSFVGRVGYYVMYGKEGGAGALPKRDRPRN